jgi:hypothetical protein
MADAEPSEGPNEPEKSWLVERHAGDGPRPVAPLAAVARTLASLPPDADDGALLAGLGRAGVLASAEALIVFGGAEEDGALPRPIGVASPDPGLAARVAAAVEREPACAIGYGERAGERGAILSSDAATTGPGESAGRVAWRAARRSAGIVAEVAAPVRHAGRSAGLLAICSTDRGCTYTDDDLERAEVLAALIGGWLAARAGARREAGLRRELEGATLAGRELAHLLNNDLTMPVGVVELLLDRSGLSADLYEMLQAASKDLEALEAHVRAFHDRMRASSGHAAGSPSER